MRPFKPWQLTILCASLITLFVFWAFFYVTNSKEQQVRSLEYDTVWSATNGRNEFYKYAASHSKFLFTGDQSDLRSARVKFEILMGRMDTWNSGAFKSYLQETPELLAVFKDLQVELERLSDSIYSPSADVSETVLQLLASAGQKIDLISGRSYQSSIKRFSDERRIFQDRLLTEKRVVMGLLVLATCLLAVVMRQNVILSRANNKIAGVAKQLSHLAKHDALTTLPNRNYLDEFLAEAKRKMSRSEFVLAVALDLDGFKAINDTLGHAGGDALLISLADKLKKTAGGLPGNNLVARVGGDEFVLLFWYPASGLRVETTIGLLAEIFETPVETSIGSLLVGASIGYSIASTTNEIDYAILNADLALTEAKALGRGSSVRFAPSMRSQLERRLQIERDLPIALKEGKIQPHYQLQHDLITGRAVGMEALARWEHSEIGMISPSEFIQIAEASGSILKLGQLMLQTACRDVQRLPASIGVSVNLSMIQLLNDDVLELVQTTLAETGLPPQRLKLEVTESVFMHNVETVSGVLSRLQHLGISISLDDFGTGYSALSYLNTFKWDELKIDRTFVTACETSTEAKNVVEVIRSLADKMNANLMVEGLETKEQANIFQSLGCRFGQGFHYSKPMSIDDICSGPFFSGRATPSPKNVNSVLEL